MVRQVRALELVVAIACSLVIFWRPGPALLTTVDAGCYAEAARELAERPIEAWANVTYDGGVPFFEHPPFALWVEAAGFRMLGATATSAIAVARFWALVSCVALYVLAVCVGGRAVAAPSILALLSMTGFWVESQNPMLEAPLMACLTIGLVGAVAPRRSLAVSLFALGVAAAWMTKGPPALVLFAALPFAVWRKFRTRQFALVLAVAGLASLVAASAAFELWRHALHLPSFFAAYFSKQVLASVTVGRHHPVANPFYYLGVLWGWYGVVLLSVPLVAFAYVRYAGPSERRAIELGWFFAGAVVAGFSLPRQKYWWYIHPAMIGFALALGGALATVLRRRLQLALVSVVAALSIAYGVLASRFVRQRPEYEALHRPSERPVATVAYCGKIGEWRARHLMRFVWNAELLACGAVADATFDGKTLTFANDT